MAVFRDPDVENYIYSCPDCGRIDLDHVQPGTQIYANHFMADPEYEKIYGENYPNHHPSQHPVLSCPYCLEDWIDYNSDWEGGYDQCTSFKGMFPAKFSQVHSINEAKDPGFSEACHYPKKCFCGECPNPNQLQFNLKGANSSWFSSDIKAWFE
jgi:hypothetical protein